MPLKMKVLQYSLLSPVDASMDSRGADFSEDGSDPGAVDGIAGGRVLDLYDLAHAQNLLQNRNPRDSHVLYLHFVGRTEKCKIKVT